MYILVTGGAGYIGSVINEELLKAGHKVVVLDNLYQGHRQAVIPEAVFVQANIGDSQALDGIFTKYNINAVIHMAAETVVEFSMTDPRRYFQNNVINSLVLLDIMLKHNVYKLIFSSSAAVYGEPETTVIDEDHPKNPINSYGESKLLFERILDWYGKAYGLKYISLRYFNAAGASELLGEDHDPETHLIPNILRAATNGLSPVPIYGTDYPTKDGSCIRDYVHVLDIAQAHILALDKLEKLHGKAYNLGNGNGYSVLEVVAAARQTTGINIPTKTHARRTGDPAVLVASSNRARTELGWRPEITSIENIIESAWRWTREHPHGYKR